MIKVFIIATILMFNNFCSQIVISVGIPTQVENKKTEVKKEKVLVKFDMETLSAKGKEAYQILLKAKTFEEGLIGYAAKLSENVKSFNVLLDEKEADEAFKSLLQNADIAGKLYALSGIYYTDNKFFKEAIKDYETNETEVERMSGCKIFGDKAKNVVKSISPKVAIISPNETMKDWREKNKGGSYELDILNGGYPATFRNYKDYKRS